MFRETGGLTRRWRRREADAPTTTPTPTPDASPVVDYEHARPERPRFTRERDWEAIAFAVVMLIGLLLLVWLAIIPYVRAAAAR